jgi:hypothetical protein
LQSLAKLTRILQNTVLSDLHAIAAVALLDGRTEKPERPETRYAPAMSCDVEAVSEP